VTESDTSLTGIWHGLYTYPGQRQPVYFVATVIDSGGNLGGMTHESEVGEFGAPLTLYASIEGSRQDTTVLFTKLYDGSGGWDHSVTYEGSLNGERTEIEGRWTIGVEASGRFLMIRSRGVTESVVRKAFEQA
jgi:hypothetical protein